MTTLFGFPIEETDNLPAPTMKVSVDGEMQDRKIVGFNGYVEFYRIQNGLPERLPFITPVPETFEGEQIVWVLGGLCFIRFMGTK